MASLVISKGRRVSQCGGITGTNSYLNGIANGKNNTIRVGYDGYVAKRMKSRGFGGLKASTKNFGVQRRND